MTAISGYDNFRQSVIEGHDQVEAHAAQVMGNLKKSRVGVSIGL